MVCISYLPFRYFLLRYQSFTKYFCKVRVRISLLPSSSCWIQRAISKKYLNVGTEFHTNESLDENLVFESLQTYPVIFFFPNVSALMSPSSPLPIQTSIRSKRSPLSHESTMAPPLSAISPSPSSGKYIGVPKGYDAGHANIPLNTFLPEAP